MIWLDARDPGFILQFHRLVDARRDSDEDVSRDVAAIISQVRKHDHDAVRELTIKFDGHDPDITGMVIGRDDCDRALTEIDTGLREALELAARRITAFHEIQRPSDKDTTDSAGVRLGSRWSAVEAAGIYVPGGRASYPSSVLMNAIPAKVAGVERIVMVTPTPGGHANPLVLAAAALVGVDEVWRIGGAQAIAALAFGTALIDPVDVITGPGNAWVAEAKRQLYGRVGIDMVAGPSEILVVADAQNDPAWIAADLLSQAEHDPTSQSILMTDDAAFGQAVAVAVEAQLGIEPSTARDSWTTNGAIIVLKTLDDAPALIDRLAPEHLELAVADPDSLFARVRHAGSVFLGRHTPEALGDYLAGPNHVLPTGRRARFSSGLSVTDFMKRTSFLSCPPEALPALGPAAIALATAEGLPAHARSVEIRL